MFENAKDLQIGNPLEKATVEYHPKGKKPVSWRKDPIILTRLSVVASIILRGGSILNISNALDYSIGTAKRDVSRVKILWREMSLEDLEEMRDQGIAQYKHVIAHAWAEFTKKANSNWLRIVIESQTRIDYIQGIQAPREILVGELDMEAIRNKRWQQVQGMMADILTEDDGENGPDGKPDTAV